MLDNALEQAIAEKIKKQMDQDKVSDPKSLISEEINKAKGYEEDWQKASAKERIYKEVLEDADAAWETPKKKWSWWMFFIVGGLLSSQAQKIQGGAGLVTEIAGPLLAIAAGTFFYRLAPKFKFFKGNGPRYLLTGFLLVVAAAFFQGCAKGIDDIQIKKQRQEAARQSLANFPEQFKSYNSKITELTEQSDQLLAKIIDPTKSTKDAEENIRILKESTEVTTSLFQQAGLAIDLLEKLYRADNITADFTSLKAEVIILREKRFKNIDAAIELNQAKIDGKKFSEISKLSESVEETAKDAEAEAAEFATLMQDVMAKAEK